MIFSIFKSILNASVDFLGMRWDKAIGDVISESYIIKFDM